MANDDNRPTPPPSLEISTTLQKEDNELEVLITSDVERTPIVFPNIQVKLDGPNMFERSKFFQLTLDSR